MKKSKYNTFLRVSTGCSLSDSNQLEIVRSPGQSVLLPCSCNELQAKPHKLTWTKLPATPLTKRDLYRDRVAMFNTESSPGNLSVLLSFITKEDQGWYRCTINNQDTRDMHITVEGKRSDNDPFYECCLHTEKQALHSPFKLTFSCSYKMCITK